ncbi:DegT/DnrJ/EryC1/StrS family aminotransferase [Nocardia sp. NPDC023852]|uniref:DegT/DnrJ/EryC1/StrS family aminotransferase n=1 Tax=Nocardia sp. NPDC023852 TaxID=3154697 RepID=UPI0033E7B0C0
MSCWRRTVRTAAQSRSAHRRTWIAESFPAANDFADRHICLPLWRGMTDDIVDRVIEIIRTSIAQAGQKLP